MRPHHPQGSWLPALEQNILKFRALEMVIILFNVENLKRFVLNSIKSTDKFRDRDKQRIPIGTKNEFKKACSALVNDGILSQEESDEVRRLVDYRNDIGHRIHLLTCDLSRSPIVEDFLQWSGNAVKYDYQALKRLKYFREKIWRGMRSRYIMVVSVEGHLFEAAEKTYQNELRRLEQKITRQIALREVEIQNLNAELSFDESGILENFDPNHEINEPSESLRTLSLLNHPLNKAANGTLTKRGIEICYWLFEHNKSTLAVACLMQISHRSAVNRRRAWEKTIGYSWHNSQ